ncbi:hypothetical protein CISIN_1g045429mg [Citrus sinensis]|uniref:Uncharacterized protein n=1 Tax=Citrus sinensis TaxID=2711 RepID=A0A067EMY3_CITSI|nr:hypothetical protein CISIN_1g045429mg [Citrus sinensis]
MSKTGYRILVLGFLGRTYDLVHAMQLYVHGMVGLRNWYIKESEELRLAMQPLELIKRVREIQQEAYQEPKTVVQKDIKQTAAVDLSKRLKDLRSANDAASIKALEEWRKRKMERARQRELEKNGTTTSQA